MPHIRKSDPTVAVSHRIKESTEVALGRIAVLLSQQTGNKHSGRQAGQWVLDTFAEQAERRLVRKAESAQSVKQVRKAALDRKVVEPRFKGKVK